MADLTETATAARRQNGGAAARIHEEHLQEQITKLQDELRNVTDQLTKLTESRVDQARATAQNLVKTGQQMADDLTSQAGAYQGQVEDAIRERPIAAVAGAIGIGFIIASLMRRR
jgi:ElaB/YqjD/DUF883 family membrane-anchored ribosome-binding protein